MQSAPSSNVSCGPAVVVAGALEVDSVHLAAAVMVAHVKVADARARAGATFSSEVVSGLSPAGKILILPSASLVQSQREFQERIRRFTSDGLGLGNSRGRRR